MRKETLAQIFLTILGVILIYAAVAFNVKIGIGVGPVDAAITSIAQITNMKVGTFSMIFHGSFFLVQLAINKRNFQAKDFLQLFFIIVEELFGTSFYT